MKYILKRYIKYKIYKNIPILYIKQEQWDNQGKRNNQRKDW